MSRAHRKKKPAIKTLKTAAFDAAAQSSQPNTTSPASPSGDFLQKAILFFFHFLLFTVPLFFTWFNEELFEFNKMVLTYACAVIITTLWIARSFLLEKVLWKRTPFDIPIALFFVSQLLSTIFSLHPHTSIYGYYTRAHGGLLSTITYILLFYACINSLEKKHIKGLFLSIFASALLVSFIAIPEHYGNSLSCSMISTSKDLESGTLERFSVSAFFERYNVNCWIQDVQNRVFATFGQPNWLAAYAITIVPAGIALFSVKRSFSFSQAFFGVATLAIFTSLLLTKSRSGVLGMGVALLGFLFSIAFVLMLQKTQQKPKEASQTLNWAADSRFFAQVGVAVVALAILIAWYGTPYTPNLETPVNDFWAKRNSSDTIESPAATLPPAPKAPALEEGGTDSGEIRKIVWKGAVDVWKRYPIFGAGVETFAYSYYKDRPVEHNLTSEWDFLYNKAHNELLNFLANSGILGLLSYLLLLAAFIGLPFLRVFSPQNAARVFAGFSHELSFGEKVLSLSLSWGLIGLTISNIFGFSTVMVTILMFLFPAFFFIVTTPENVTTLTTKKADSSEEISFSLPQVVSLSLVSLIGVFSLVTVWNMWYADYLLAKAQQFAMQGEGLKAAETYEKAIRLAPNESTFYDHAGTLYANLAVRYAEAENFTQASAYMQKAKEYSKKMLDLNPAEVNNYKKYIYVLLELAKITPDPLPLYIQVKAELQQAQELAPTDPKLPYMLGLIQTVTDEDSAASVENLEKSIALKPNYEPARMLLAEIYSKQGKSQEAVTQYQYILEKIQPNNEVAKQRIIELTNPKMATPSSVLKKP